MITASKRPTYKLMTVVGVCWLLTTVSLVAAGVSAPLALISVPAALLTVRVVRWGYPVLIDRMAELSACLHPPSHAER